MRRRKLALAFLALAATAVPSATAAAEPQKPMLTAKPPEWTTAQTATFAFAKAASEDVSAFECRLDAALYTACVPDPVPPNGLQEYVGLAEGVHTFRVRAVDLTPTPGDERTYTWTIDLTPPVLDPTGDVVAEATSASGATVTYALPTATDNLDDAPTVACTPAPGSLFPIGATTITCTPTDHAKNVGASATFDLRVRDTTAPTLNPYPDIVVQQDSPAGATVAFDPWPTAVDAVDGQLPATCSPNATSQSPTLFALADSPVPVVCGATDSTGNASASVTLFRVIVNAGAAPPEPTITAHPADLSSSPVAAFEFSASGAVSTTCRLDGPSPVPSEPCTSGKTYSGLADGPYVFTVEARDTTIGTISQATYSWQVDTAAPGPVAKFDGRAGAGVVRLTWQAPTEPDYAKVRISRQRLGGPWRVLRNLISATRFSDRGVPNDVRFRYRIQSYDAAGNVSAAAYTVERPSRIFAPAYEAALTRPPLIDWTAVRKATYYNIQVWRNGRKILSRWPLRSSLQLRSTWHYRGSAYELTAARYTVFVWPGFGRPAAARYGSLLGTTSFRVQ